MLAESAMPEYRREAWCMCAILNLLVFAFKIELKKQLSLIYEIHIRNIIERGVFHKSLRGNYTKYDVII